MHYTTGSNLFALLWFALINLTGTGGHTLWVFSVIYRKTGRLQSLFFFFFFLFWADRRFHLLMCARRLNSIQTRGHSADQSHRALDLCILYLYSHWSHVHMHLDNLQLPSVSILLLRQLSIIAVEGGGGEAMKVQFDGHYDVSWLYRLTPILVSEASRYVLCVLSIIVHSVFKSMRIISPFILMSWTDNFLCLYFQQQRFIALCYT
jgi:hypothetical protein